MRCVAFMRNVNQGQRGHPSTDDIRAGFADAGLADVEMFQSNGTILFDSPNPGRVVERATAAIAARSGQERDILWTPLTTLVAVVETHGATPEPRRFEFALHRAVTVDPDAADVRALASEHRCAVVDAGRGWSLVRNDVEGEGHATPVLEQLTGGRASSRGLPTLIRLAARFGDAAG